MNIDELEVEEIKALLWAIYTAEVEGTKTSAMNRASKKLKSYLDSKGVEYE